VNWPESTIMTPCGVLGLPKGELLDDIRKRQCPLSLFLSNVNDCVIEKIKSTWKD